MDNTGNPMTLQEPVMDQRTKNRIRIRKIAFIAMLAALASALMILETSLPFIPPDLKYDISELPVLIGAFAFGPLSAIVIELIKNLIHLTVTNTSGVGEMANFIAGVSFAGTAGIVYRFNRTHRGAIAAMIVGTVSLTVIMSVLNYLFILDLYMKVFGGSVDDFVRYASSINSFVKDKSTLVLWVFVPLNLFKGITVSFITLLVYKPISKLINRLAGA